MGCNELEKIGYNGINQSIEPEGNSKIIIEKDFDVSKVDSAFKDFFKGISPKDEDSRLFYFTEPHVGSKSRMGLFGDFAPSVVFAANRFNKLHLPVREKYLREFGYGKLSHLYCTLDKSVMFGFQNKYMARSKIHNLNSVASIFHRPGLKIDEERLKGKDISDDKVIKVLFEIKKNATKLFGEVKCEALGYSTIKQSEHNFSYPSLLEKIVGADNLIKILLYGSSAKGHGNDFDNLGVLQTIPPDFYEKIRGTKPNENGKEVGVIFIPEDILENFLYVNVSNSLLRQSSKSLKGEFEVPIESPRYQIFKEAYHAGVGSAKLLSGMNLVYRKPELFFDKPGLFDYFMKLNRFTLQGLSQNEKYVSLSKEETLEKLKKGFDFEIPKFKADVSYLQECFLKANKASIEIASKLYNPRLAMEGNEFLAELQQQFSRKIFKADYQGLDLYVFGMRETMSSGDIVPVRILDKKERDYSSKREELNYRGITNKKRVLIGKRV
ncbi:MAG: hypothetical protein PHH54_00140 [Candidatus Nanoarchaeia archaeon]|nr:hypothetical protein [Candidatus Nanoarchaeia archaeon]MDD5740371.1 hypothetical protein [Candidatus Nanoarchaeia archaeon]